MGPSKTKPVKSEVVSSGLPRPNRGLCQPRFGGEQLASALANKHHRPAGAHSAGKKCPPSEPLQPEVGAEPCAHLIWASLTAAFSDSFCPTTATFTTTECLSFTYRMAHGFQGKGSYIGRHGRQIVSSGWFLGVSCYRFRRAALRFVSVFPWFARVGVFFLSLSSFVTRLSSRWSSGLRF